MRKTFIIWLIFFSQCLNQKNTYHFKLAELKRVEQLVSIQPPPAAISFARVYLVVRGDGIYESNFMRLKDAYDHHYKNAYPTFSDFLFVSLNQEMKIDTNSARSRLFYSQVFVLDSNIALLYKGKGIKALKDKYCVQRSDFYTLKEDKLALNEINSISYYFFINRYLRYNDDYNATINFKNFDLILN